MLHEYFHVLSIRDQIVRYRHDFRPFEGFNAYIRDLVASTIFKWVILILIIMNASLLAFEAGGEPVEGLETFYSVLDDVCKISSYLSLNISILCITSVPNVLFFHSSCFYQFTR